MRAFSSRSCASTLVALCALGATVLGSAPAAAAAPLDDAEHAEDAPAPPPAAEPTIDDRASPTDESTGERREHVRVGVIGGLGFPRPLAIQAMVKFERTFAIGLEYSAMPQTQFGDVLVGWRALALDARVFPLQGAFFLGLRAVRQHLQGSASISAGSYGTYSGSVSTDTWYVEPRLGFLWTWRSGITVGLDAGLQIPLSHTNADALPSGIAVPSSVSSVRDLFGASKLPTVTLLQVGALF